MRGWTEPDDDASRPGPAAPEPDPLDELQAHGIDLDPVPHGHHRHGDLVHADGHTHPHVRSEPGDPPVIGIVGAGAVGTALGVALRRAGWPVAAVASRDTGRRERFRSLVEGARAFAEAEALLDEVELIVLTVPDDAIAPMAGRLRMYSGQAMIHTSGLLGADVLAPAMAAGTQIGSFHPLVAFADVERSVDALGGATIAIEGDEQLAGLLADMAEAIGGVPVRLAPGSKPAYHAAAVLAAGGFVALLDAIAELGAVAGLDETGALAVYGRLIEQTLDNARVLGIRTALTGPLARGDRGTVAAHLASLHAHAPGVVNLYRAAAEREIALAEARGTLPADGAAALREELARTLASPA